MAMTSMAYSQPAPVSSGKLGNVGANPYSVNGISLSSPNLDLMHPAMGYQGKGNTQLLPIQIRIKRVILIISVNNLSFSGCAFKSFL